MAEFTKRNKLNADLERIFEEAETDLILISPYIKLHSRFIDILKSKKNNDKLSIIIVFGKNENNIANSINKEDFEFLKEFPNIEIKYESKLHAKYYSNEYTSLLSSMNLYDFSQNNNIEFGILSKTSLIGGSLDKESFSYFQQVIENAESLFSRKPLYEDKLFGIQKKYSCSEIEIDILSKEFKLERKTELNSEIGYCIRTGKKIPFNIEKPFCKEAFYEWNEWGNENYRENFCHFSGEESYGETTIKKPVLNKNYKLIKKR